MDLLTALAAFFILKPMRRRLALQAV